MNNLFEFNQNAINELEQDVELGKFPNAYVLADHQATAAIQFLAILAYPLPQDADKRERFILANMAGQKKTVGLELVYNINLFACLAYPALEDKEKRKPIIKADMEGFGLSVRDGFKLNQAEKLKLNEGGRNLTEIKKILSATDRAGVKLTHRLMHAHAYKFHIDSLSDKAPKTMAKALYEVMDCYETADERRCNEFSMPDGVKANQQNAYKRTIPVLHYVLAYWKVLSVNCMDPQDYILALSRPEWLPDVVALGNRLLASQNHQQKISSLEKGDMLNRFDCDEKVIFIS